jgi:hypothetical protein
MKMLSHNTVLSMSAIAMLAAIAASGCDDETSPATTGGSGGTGGTGGVVGMGGDGGMGGGQAPGCFMGGTDAQAAAADGKCGDPIIIDMTGMSAGDIVFHTVNSNQHGDDMYVWGYGGCSDMSFDTAANDYVFQVLVDVGVTRLDVSVDGLGAADPQVAIIEDASCGQPVNACSNDNGAGACEWVGGTQMDGVWFGTGPYVLVSEQTDSGEDLTIRFRIDGTP